MKTEIKPCRWSPWGENPFDHAIYIYIPDKNIQVPTMTRFVCNRGRKAIASSELRVALMRTKFSLSSSEYEHTANPFAQPYDWTARGDWLTFDWQSMEDGRFIPVIPENIQIPSDWSLLQDDEHRVRRDKWREMWIVAEIRGEIKLSTFRKRFLETYHDSLNSIKSVWVD